MEASFSGMSIGPYKDQHLNTQHLENMGKHLCQTLADYIQQEPAIDIGDLKLESTKTGIPVLPSVVPRKGVKPKSHKGLSSSGGGVFGKAKPKTKPKKV